MPKYADIRIDITVEFEDDGELDLRDQAIEAAQCAVTNEFAYSADFELIGEIRDTELPKQDHAE